MTIQYKCGKCGEQCSNKAKLKRHMLLKHNVEEIKIEQFDNLKKKFFLAIEEERKKKEKFHELLSKLVEIENESHLKRLKGLRADNEPLANYIETEKDDSIPSGWTKYTKNVSYLHQKNQQMTTVIKEKYKAPDGAILSGKRDAILYLKKLKYSDEDVDRLKESFEKDDWVKLDGPLTGWLMRAKKNEKNNKVAYSFLNCDLHFFSNKRLAMSNLLKYGTEEQVIAFIEDVFSRNKRNTKSVFNKKIPFPWRVFRVDNKRDLFVSPDGQLHTKLAEVFDYLDKSKDISIEAATNFKSFLKRLRYLKKTNSTKTEDDTESNNSSIDVTKNESNESIIEYTDCPFMPPGWKFSIGKRRHPISGHFMIEQFKGPYGKAIQGKINALKYLYQHRKDYSDSDLEKAFNSLEDNGWRKISGCQEWRWKKSHANLWFLSPDMNKFRSAVEVTAHMKKTKISQETIDNFNIFMGDSNLRRRNTEENNSYFRKQKTENEQRNWVSDETLPESWRLHKEKRKEILKNGDGKEFLGRKSAIDFMIKEKYSPTDIFKLWNTLYLDGWVDDAESLPTGWKKKYFGKTNSYHFLSPLMEEVNSKAELLAKIEKNNNDYTLEDIEKVKCLA